MKKEVWSVLLAFVFICALILFGCSKTPPEPEIPKAASPAERSEMVPRVSPDEAYQKAESGGALLVCAYESEETCRSIHLTASIFLDEFEARLPSLGKEQEIIFYCA